MFVYVCILYILALLTNEKEKKKQFRIVYPNMYHINNKLIYIIFSFDLDSCLGYKMFVAVLSSRTLQQYSIPCMAWKKNYCNLIFIVKRSCFDIPVQYLFIGISFHLMNVQGIRVVKTQSRILIIQVSLIYYWNERGVTISFLVILYPLLLYI